MFENSSHPSSSNTIACSKPGVLGRARPRGQHSCAPASSLGALILGRRDEEANTASSSIASSRSLVEIPAVGSRLNASHGSFRRSCYLVKHRARSAVSSMSVRSARETRARHRSSVLAPSSSTMPHRPCVALRSRSIRLPTTGERPSPGGRELLTRRNPEIFDDARLSR